MPTTSAAPSSVRRILVIGGSVRAGGGVEEYCKRLCQILQGHGREATWTVSETNVRPVGVRSIKAFVAALWKIRAQLHTLDTGSDVVWLQYGNGLDPFLALLTRRWFSGRILCTMHVASSWRHLSAGTGRIVAARFLSAVDVLCYLSKGQSSLLPQFQRQTLLVPTLLPNWVNESGTVEDTRTGVLFAGRLVQSKGIEDALQAFAQAETNEELHVAGNGDKKYVQYLKELATQLRIGNRVQWHGQLPGDRLHVLMYRTRLLLHPSSVDAFPLTVLEGMACGLPVVAYDLTGVAEIVREHGGRIVRPGDVRGLADALREGSALSVETAGVREKYRWSVVARSYLSVLEAVA